MEHLDTPKVEERRYPPHPTTACAARRFVAALLTDEVEDMRDTACLLTSELVTNAVIHARTAVDVRVLQFDGRLRIQVSDENTRLPTPALIPDDATTGRGLLLVQVLASSWGVEQAGGGKVVWFELEWRQPR